MPLLNFQPSKHPTQGKLRKLNGQDKIIIALLLFLPWLWITPVRSEPIQYSEFKIQNQDQTHSKPLSVVNDNVLNANDKSPVIENELLVTGNWSLITDLPCLNSSSECIDLLTEKAIAHSSELQTIQTRIGLLDTRLGIATDSINYAESKLWTNYIPDAVPTNPFSLINPFSLLKNIFGGGDIQKSRIAIADLQLKKANVEVQRVELERRYSEVQDQMREKILTLVLEYEATGRQIAMINEQINHHRIVFKVMEIDYRFRGSSTEAYVQAIEKEARLENELIHIQTSQREFLGKIISLTGS